MGKTLLENNLPSNNQEIFYWLFLTVNESCDGSDRNRMNYWDHSRCQNLEVVLDLIEFRSAAASYGCT